VSQTRYKTLATASHRGCAGDDGRDGCTTVDFLQLALRQERQVPESLGVRDSLPVLRIAPLEVKDAVNEV